MILKEFLDVANLFDTQAFCNYKVTKIIVICKNKDFIFIIF